ncbi:hypothetical protein BU17DRAFT_62725 [Hysterangium stoloniferum]|nr:hypothetical protein BU17DRAFT_62725 [Hysterangium stoloniferum]
MEPLLAVIPNGQTEIAETLVKEINNLLNVLSLPIRVDTPYDLTPSLLLAILESVLRDRLPISTVTRESRTPTAKVEAMKVFLGVLEDDVLQLDIGLSEVDPRKLAAGNWDEVVFVGQTLCWLARTRLHAEEYRAKEQPSCSSMSGSSGETNLDMGSSRLGYDASETTATTLPSLDPTSPVLDPQLSPGRAPRCIHELDFSYLSVGSPTDVADDKDIEDICECQDPKEPENTAASFVSKTRHEGFIQHVDDDVDAFETRNDHVRSKKGKKTSLICGYRKATSSSVLYNPTRHTSPSQHTAALLVERARLLEELAKVKKAGLSG